MGLPDAFILGEKFIDNNGFNFSDNFFYGQSLDKLKDALNLVKEQGNTSQSSETRVIWCCYDNKK